MNARGVADALSARAAARGDPRPWGFWATCLRMSLLALSLAACEDAEPLPSAEPPTGIEAVVSERVGTVITVRWSTETVTTGYVRFGEDGALDRVTPATADGTEHEVLLLGMPSDTDVSFEVIARSSRGEAAADVQTVRTDPLPAGFPVLTITGDPAAGPAYQVLPIDGTANLVIIVDRWGRVVWYDQPDRHLIRALVSPTRDSVVICGAAGPGEPVVRWVAWDGTPLREVEIPGSRMDLTLLPDGTLTSIVSAAVEGNDLLGDAVVELSPDGVSTEVWNSWTDIDLSNYDIEDIQVGSDAVHANALDYLPELDAYTLSLAQLRTTLLFDRSTGDRLWTMFGNENDWEYLDGTTAPPRMHQHQLLDDSIVYFENGDTDALESRVAEYRMDAVAMTLDEIWSYTADPALYTLVKGDVVRREDDSTLVVWSTSGEVQVVDSAGQVEWQLNAELGYVFLYVDVLEDLYAE